MTIRTICFSLIALISFVGISQANGGDCCAHCGCQLNCEVKCEWATRQVLRYKAAHTECSPPYCVCCDDRWIIGCPKPIKILSLKPHYEEKRTLLGRYVVRTCPHCDYKDSEPLPPELQPDEKQVVKK